MSDILRFFFIIVLLTIGLTAYFLIIGVLFPRRVEKTQHTLSQVTGRVFGVGFVNLLFFGVIALILLTLTNGANRVDNWVRVILLFPTAGVWVLIAILLSFGFTGAVNMLGEKLFPEQSKLKQTVWGTVVLTFACALPFVGWFLLLPYIGFVSVGAVILGFFQRNE